MFLGDSFTAGSQVTQSSRYTAFVAQSVSAKVVNLGMSAYGTVQEFKVYERFAGLVDPSYVFVQFYSNDLEDNLLSTVPSPRPIATLGRDRLITYEDNLLSESVWRNQLDEFKASGYLPGDRSGVFGKSHLIAKSRVTWRKVKNWWQLHPLRFRSPPGPFGSLRWMYTPSNQSTAEEYGVFEQVLNDLNAAVEADGAQLGLLYIPDEPEINGSKLLKDAASQRFQLADIDAQLLFSRIKAIADGLGVPVIDARKALIEAQNNGEQIYWEEDRHLTGAGHRAVADSVLEWVGSRQ